MFNRFAPIGHIGIGVLRTDCGVAPVFIVPVCVPSIGKSHPAR